MIHSAETRHETKQIRIGLVLFFAPDKNAGLSRSSNEVKQSSANDDYYNHCHCDCIKSAKS